MRNRECGIVFLVQLDQEKEMLTISIPIWTDLLGYLFLKDSSYSVKINV